MIIRPLFWITVVLCALSVRTVAQLPHISGANDELEPGYGLSLTSMWDDWIPYPKVMVAAIAVNPDGQTLAYMEDGNVLVKDLVSGVVTDLGYGHNVVWCGDGNWLVFWQAENPNFWVNLTLWNRRTGEFRHPAYRDSAYGRLSRGAGGDLYFMDQRGPLFGGQVLYRMYVDQTLSSDTVRTERLGVPTRDPAFHPHDSTVYLGQLQDPRLPESVDGFSVIRTSGDGFSRKDIVLPLPDTVWDRQVFGRGGVDPGSPWHVMGADGMVLLFRNFRDKEEIRMPPFNPATLAARNASGWYLVDTNGVVVRQVIRSWTVGLGMSVDSSGNFYYGFLMPDSTVAIWTMKGDGTGKRQVTFPKVSSVPPSGDRAVSRGISIQLEAKSSDGVMVFRSTRVTPGPVRYSLVDILGRSHTTRVTVSSSDALSDRISVSTDALPHGSYFLTATDEEGRVMGTARLTGW